MNKTEERVIRLKEGSMEARDELVQELLPLVKFLAAKFMRTHPHKADEIMSAAFENLVSRLEYIRNGYGLRENNNIGAYINSTTVWAVKKVAYAKDREEFEVEPYVYNAAEKRLELEDVYALGTNEEERHMLELRAKGYSQEEIGQMLGVSQQKVSITLRILHEVYKSQQLS